MCGIVGVLNFGPPIIEGIDKSRESAIFLGITMLELSEPRGKNATGIVSAFDDSMFVGQKMGISAIDFIARFGGKKEDFDSFTKVVREYNSGLRSIIGHCRKNSVGNSFDNSNNHPIKAGSIIGVHNGTLNNHTEIFDHLKCDRDGDVDSEAVIRMLEFYTEGGTTPFTIDMLYETGSRLNGSFSVLAFNTNNPNQIISMRDARPAEYCLIKPLNMVLVASEKKFFERAIWEYNKAGNLFGHPGFITLKVNDVEYSTLLDESVALFDLTKEIKDDTKITDLYETKRLPVGTARLWKSPVKNNNYHNRTYGQTKTSTDIDRNYSPTGQVSNKRWDRGLNMFVNANTGDSGKKKQLTNSNQLGHNELALVEYTNEDYDDIMPVAEVKEHKVDIVKKKIIKKEEIVTELGTPEERRAATVDKIKQQAKDGKKTTQHLRAAAAAAIIAAKDVEKFKTDEDISILCNIDIEVLKKLNTPALANRILKSVFSTAYRQGWLAKCETVEVIDAEKKDRKAVNAERTIRVLKTLATGLNNEMSKTMPDFTNRCIKTFVDKLPSGTEFNKEAVKKAFNAKELKEGLAHEVITALNKE